MFKPDADAVYLCDNGMALCGAHLGATASMTGRDLSGQPIHRLNPEEALEMNRDLERFGLACRCEECGKPAPVLHRV